jgi:hypothetical protein
MSKLENVLLWIVIGVWLFAFAQIDRARAFDFHPEVRVGHTWFQGRENGYWYQEELEHDIDLTDVSFGAGVRIGLTDKINLHVGYQRLGKVEIDALATASDENYHAWREGKEELWPTSRFISEGTVQGVYLAGSYEFTKRIYAMAGAFAFDREWKVTVPDYRNTRDWPTPYKLEVENDEGIRVNPMFGLGYRFTDHIAAEVSGWFVGGKRLEFPPFYRAVATNVGIAITF